ncbi:MAG: xanthine dehydrogenase family protein subunit M [Rhizobiales bacterium]|nr:xanthine dehydrogenase family protein subunit M [Hyphomicrobiales bacterium]MBI3674202.1 xanthine dehydrogenase family protein subunit M [Hyphomicrobiales bacterium]
MYARPRTLQEAVAALSQGHALLLAGGTDVYPAHVGQPLPEAIVDLSGVTEMRGIVIERDWIRIGGATTWSEVIAARLPPAFDCLKEAAREVGSLQIQNRGTVAGNLCNASPAADGVPPLLTLDAEVELAGPSGFRRLPLSSFITGYRRTALQPGEILASILVPRPVETQRSAFVKLGARRYLVISIVMVAASVGRDGKGQLTDVRVAVGSASAVAQRLPGLERDLEDLAPGIRPSTQVKPKHISSLTPIDDVRATAAYRKGAALELIGRALDRAAGA